MGRYINISNNTFSQVLGHEYIDKSLIIAEINSSLDSERRMSCVTRCRRFGKSMAAAMLCAYYDKSCDSRELFRGLKIENEPSFEEHLNKYRVIYITMSDFISEFGHCKDIVAKIQKALIKDVKKAYREMEFDPEDDLMNVLLDIATETGERFIMIIDEWDALCREFMEDEEVTNTYINLLRRLFKGQSTSRVFAGAYITGILPIKKYNTQSALNNFWEYTMLYPGHLASYYGFTPGEVKNLCDRHGINFDEMVKWYDGYQIGEELSMFNPNSVMKAIANGVCTNYWNATGAFDIVTRYIQMNFDGLKDDIISMLSGARCPVLPGRFSNDLKQIKNRDDVLTVLIHFGYLSYDFKTKECYIPNGEVREEMVYAVKDSDWHEVNNAIEASEALLAAVLRKDEEAVAAGVEKVHQRDVSILSYNDENSLACVLSLAFYSARNKYVIHRELHTGKGFADLIFIPRKNENVPAIVMELKYNKDTKRAIEQIRNRDYPELISEYTRDVLLVGINYDPTTKQHTCAIQSIG